MPKLIIKNHGVWLQILFSGDEVFELNCERIEIAERLCRKLNNELSVESATIAGLLQRLPKIKEEAEKLGYRNGIQKCVAVGEEHEKWITGTSQGAIVVLTDALRNLLRTT